MSKGKELTIKNLTVTQSSEQVIVIAWRILGGNHQIAFSEMLSLVSSMNDSV